MEVYQTYLAPGQRYLQPGGVSWRGSDRQVTIVRLDRDHFGFPRVTFRGIDGREVMAYAVQIEAAIADGELSPVVGAGSAARC
jgi:hypothetical protein